MKAVLSLDSMSCTRVVESACGRMGFVQSAPRAEQVAKNPSVHPVWWTHHRLREFQDVWSDHL